MAFNIPNILTLARVIAAPFVALAFLIFERPVADIVAFVVFFIASLTDYVDGWLARKWDQVSGFGRMLDPIADKAMVAVTGAVLLGLYEMAPLVVIPVVVILMRETLVSGLREYLKGARILDVTLMAKWKTTVQMLAMGVLLVAEAIGPSVVTLGLVLLWIAAALTAITGWDYFSKGLAYINAEEET